MDNPGKTKQHWDTQDENDQNKNTLQDAQRGPHQRPGMDPFDDEGKLDIMLTKFMQISFEINSCHESC
jgi:hypothetical protein